MILSNTELQHALEDGRLIIDPRPNPLRPATGGRDCPYQTSSVDLRLGADLACYRKETLGMQLDLRKGGFAKVAGATTESRKLAVDQPFSLVPQQFLLAKTLERVGLPLSANRDKCLAARIEGKSSYARCGLLVHFTAPTIHAGFDGTITLEMMNLGSYPILLYWGMSICQLIVEEVQGAPFRNDSQFQHQDRPTGR